VTLREQLEELGACLEGIEWIEDRSLQQAWAECWNGHWMIWLVYKMKGKEGWLTEIDFILLDYITNMMSIEIYKENDTDILDLKDKSNLARANYIREKFTPPSGNLL
jgi:hypothetical protein